MAIVDKLLEADGTPAPSDDLDAPGENVERYMQAIGAQKDEDAKRVLDRFKKAARAYIRWAHTDEEMGQMYDNADLRRISKAASFEQVQQILAKYETTPSFLSMVSQGYFV